MCNRTATNTLTSGTNHALSITPRRIGIGTTDPQSALHIYAPIDDTTQIKGIHLGYQSGANNDNMLMEFVTPQTYTNIDFKKTTGNADGQGRISYNVDNDYMSFSTTLLNERMRIDNIGNVGIATDAPDANTKLDVRGSIRGNHDTDTTSYFGRAAVGFVDGHTDNASFSHLDHNTSTKYALKQDETGNVHLNANNDVAIFVKSADVTQFTFEDHQLYDTDSGISKWESQFILDTNKKCKIAIDGYMATRGIINENQKTATPSAILFGKGDTFSDNEISFITNGETRMFMDVSGLVGINTDSMIYKLDVNGDIRTTTQLYVDGKVGIGTRDVAAAAKVDISGNVYSDYDRDSISVFGRVALGYLGATKSDYATFSHLDNKTITNYSLAQAPDGTTYLNAPSNKDIVFNTNDTSSFYMRDTTLYSTS